MDHLGNQRPLRRRSRVLFANATADVGGAEQVILSLADQLPSLGFDVSYAFLRPGPLASTLKQRGLDVHVFPEEFRYRDVMSVLRCIRWLTERIRSTRANLLHSNLTAHFIGGWAARRAHVPELWHLHDYPFHFDPVHAFNRLVPADFCVFTTEFLKGGEPFLARGAHAVVKPNCIDVEKLRLAPTRPEAWERLDLQPQRYFLTVTRLQEHKGHIYLIEAAALIHKLHPEVKFVIAGRAKGAEQETYLARLKEQTQKAGLRDNIVFAGFVPEDDLPALFRGAIGLVHPAVTEGYGLVLLEAMAQGTPIVAASAAGPAEIIQDRRNGLLVPVRNSSRLYEAMMTLMHDKVMAETLGEQGGIDVNGMNSQVMAEEIASIYRSMLENA